MQLWKKKEQKKKNNNNNRRKKKKKRKKRRRRRRRKEKREEEEREEEKLHILCQQGHIDLGTEWWQYVCDAAHSCVRLDLQTCKQ